MQASPHTMTLLPPAAGCCKICARKHEPNEAHDALSFYYLVRFDMVHGRQGTWADAIAHCPPEDRALWAASIRK
ncbi:MAG: hypothetical protein R3E96_17230, partial [Planctomycetota bacterium]